MLAGWREVVEREEPTYAEVGVLDQYFREARFPLEVGVMTAGSASALRAMQVPGVTPLMPRRLPHGRGKPIWTWVLVGASLAIIAGSVAYAAYSIAQVEAEG